MIQSPLSKTWFKKIWTFTLVNFYYLFYYLFTSLFLLQFFLKISSFRQIHWNFCS